MLSSFEVITTRESGKWKQILDETMTYDFHHLPAYHRLAEIEGEGEAVMAVFREEGHLIAFPMLLRYIELPAGRGLRDVTSVHGYAGPLSSLPEVPEGVKRHFQEQLQDYFVSQSIVSAFSRLHPLMNQSETLGGIGRTVELGVTLSIDLTLPPEVQRSQYRKDIREDTNRLKRDGFGCEVVGSEYLEDFLHIYYETMQRTGADAYHFFDRLFFEFLLTEMSDVMRLFVCRQGDLIVSANLISLCRGIIQTHLGGTLTDYLRHSPKKILYDSIRLWGIDVGAHTMHLGAGVGARRDSLFEFKRAFTKREHAYLGWQHIVDEHAYDELSKEALGSADLQQESSYFPLYRGPVPVHDAVVCPTGTTL